MLKAAAARPHVGPRWYQDFPEPFLEPTSVSLIIPPLDPTHHRRLGLARALYLRGQENVRRPEPLCGLCLLDLHDAAEIFIRVICDVHHVPVKPKTYLTDYWELVKQKTTEDLGFKVSMENLNTQRNNLKHAGIAPSRKECESAASKTEDFLRENSVRFLGVSFDALSIVDLVQWPHARHFLKVAESRQAGADHAGVIDYTAIAFAVLLIEYHECVSARYGSTPRAPRVRVRTRGVYPGGDDVEAMAQDVDNEIQALHDEFRLLSLGLEYTHYEHFRLLAPHVVRQWDGLGTLILDYLPGRPVPAAVDAQFCFDFVITSALRLQELAATLNLAAGKSKGEPPPVQINKPERQPTESDPPPTSAT